MPGTVTCAYSHTTRSFGIAASSCGRTAQRAGRAGTSQRDTSLRQLATRWRLRGDLRAYVDAATLPDVRLNVPDCLLTITVPLHRAVRATLDDRYRLRYSTWRPNAITAFPASTGSVFFFTWTYPEDVA